MSDLPENWTSASISELSKIIRGVTYSKNDARDQPSKELIPVLRATNITERGLVLDDLVYVPRKLVKEEQIIKAGDVIAAISSGSITVVGKAKQTQSDLDAAFGAFCAVLRPVEEINKKYFGHFFGTQYYRFTVSSLARGVNINNLKREHFEQIEIPLAPLHEQKRIAEKLDQVLARVDACQTHLERVPQILKRFRQSVLAAATSGLLTEGWREEKGVNFEKDWKAIKLGDYVDNHDGKRIPISEKIRSTRRGEYPYYGASGVIDTIDSFTHEGKFLLIGEDGANLLTRSKPIAFIAEGKIWVNNHAHVLTCKNGEPEEYLNYYINAIDLSPYVSGSAQPKLNQKNMNDIVVPVPPIEEQAEIVRRVEKLFAYAAKLEARYQSASEQVARLTPSLLAKAFRGELVGQDPNDEPASALVGRIRETRDTEKADPSVKSKKSKRS